MSEKINNQEVKIYNFSELINEKDKIILNLKNQNDSNMSLIVKMTDEIEKLKKPIKESDNDIDNDVYDLKN